MATFPYVIGESGTLGFPVSQYDGAPMFRDLLTPEAQSQPHPWAATFGAHCWLALGPWGAIAIGWNMWTAAWVTPLLYLILWEGFQLIRSGRVTRALIWDSILDTTGLALGCYAAACIGNGMKFEALSCWAASIVIMAVGWGVRESR